MLRHRQRDLVDVTPGPTLAGLVGSHQGVARVVEMLRRVPSRRAVAAADVAAAQAEPEVDPAQSRLQALLAARGPRGDWLGLEQVLARHSHVQIS